jgi:competence protein ComEA
MDQGMPARYRGYIVVCTVLGLIGGGVIGYFTPRPAPDAPIAVATPLPTATPYPTVTPLPMRIHVDGAVEQPGVYDLPPGSIVQDAIEVAGGPTVDADVHVVNLAIELQDQQKVYVPLQGELDAPAPVSGGEPGNEVTTGRLIDINAARAVDLETLPRIGPSIAQRIVEYREANGPFKTIEDIQDVPGIGPSTFEGIKDLITVGS